MKTDNSGLMNEVKSASEQRPKEMKITKCFLIRKIREICSWSWWHRWRFRRLFCTGMRLLHALLVCAVVCVQLTLEWPWSWSPLIMGPSLFMLSFPLPSPRCALPAVLCQLTHTSSFPHSLSPLHSVLMVHQGKLSSLIGIPRCGL